MAAGSSSWLTASVALASLALGGCKIAEPDSGRPHSRPTAGNPPTISDFLRGKAASWVPRVNIQGVEFISVSLLTDLKNNFLSPIGETQFRFVIDAIDIDATSEEFAQWTVDIRLDTGAKISLHRLGEFFDDSGESHFDAAFEKVATALRAEGQRDPALRRCFREEGKGVGSRRL